MPLTYHYYVSKNATYSQEDHQPCLGLLASFLPYCFFGVDGEKWEDWPEIKPLDFMWLLLAVGAE